MRSLIALVLSSCLGACAGAAPVTHFADSGTLQTDAFYTSEESAQSEKTEQPRKPLRVYFFFGDHGG